jgi:flagellar biosynthesis/type III secretory pathway M-ring protein FliF/YscJ
MNDAAQKDQYMSYARLGALAIGPILMLLVLFLLLRGGRKKAAPAATQPEAAATTAGAAVDEPTPAVAPVAPSVPGRKPHVAQPISEDPQKVYIREQIQVLGKSNPATVAQLIQTWMDEDRRN